MVQQVIKMQMDVIVEIYKANLYMKRAGWTIEEKRAFWTEMKQCAAIYNNESLPEKITMSNV